MLYLDDLIDQGKDARIKFSYQVVTTYDKSKSWEHRLDHYLETGKVWVHFSTICVNFAIILCLAGILFFILKRGIGKDLDQWIKDNVSRQV